MMTSPATDSTPEVRNPCVVSFIDRGTQQDATVRLQSEGQARALDLALDQLQALERLWRRRYDDMRLSFLLTPEGHVVGYHRTWENGCEQRPIDGAPAVLRELGARLLTDLQESVLYGLLTEKEARSLRADVRRWQLEGGHRG